MKRALLVGSFDPPTLGHLNLIERASHLCETLVVGVGICCEKHAPLFSQEERVNLLAEITSHLSNLEIVAVEGLTVAAAEQYRVDALIRGVRSLKDWEREREVASANRRLGGPETLFLPSDEQVETLSASLIKEIATFGGPLDGFVPDQIKELVHLRIMTRTDR